MYKPTERIDAFAIKKYNFNIIMKEPLAKQLISKIKKNYINKVRNPIVSHREIEARKFKTRIDYVDLSAFGVGVIIDDNDKSKHELKIIENQIVKLASVYGRLMSHL